MLCTTHVNLYFLVLLLVFHANERTTNDKRKEKENKNFHKKRTSEISNALRFT